jgi:hypothetical protein
MKLAVILGWVGAITLLSFGCSSSGSSGGSGGGGNFDCTSGCQTIVAAQCPNDTQQGCEQECSADMADQGSCAGTYSTYLGCVIKLPLHCGTDGKATIDQAGIMSSCSSTAISYAKCIACLADASDSACESCVKQSCCSEMQAIYNDPNISAYLQCYNACTDSACQSNCITQYPTIQDKGAAVSTCRQSKCASACGTP